MDIFFAVNNDYVSKLCVTIFSILENNQQTPISFYVLNTNITNKSKKELEKLINRYSNANIEYIQVDFSLFENFKTSIEYISKETFFRYIIADVAPNLKKCLYLDADIVVNGNLSSLWQKDISDFYAAGVEDSYVQNIRHKEKLGLSAKDLYINAGVLLLNLENIRKNNITKELFNNTIKWQNKILFQDQDVINITLKNKIKPLDSIYNFMTENAKKEKNKRNNAIIIHYTGKCKPWMKGCKNKMRKIWLNYEKKYHKENNNFISKIKNLFYRQPDFDIDLVYLWCDGSDPTFIKRKNEALKKEGKLDIQATTAGRFEQIDELKFSLRSVEKYMPWIHHIFIIIDRQLPKWLDLTNRKISIIDHSQILPQDSIPIFNSCAIETCLHKIPHLSEHFLYANDDMFVWRKVKPSFFFTNTGKIIFRYQRDKLHLESLYDRKMLYTQNKMKAYSRQLFYTQCITAERINIFCDFLPHHNIDSYLKSDCLKCSNIFRAEFDETVHHPFRKENDISRLIFSFYSLTENHLNPKDVTIKKWQKYLIRYTPFCRVDSFYQSNNGKLKRIKQYNPALFCINDTEYSSDEHRKIAFEFLNNRFPSKSSFEK